MQCQVDESYNLITRNKTDLQRISEPGLVLEISIDPQRQRSTPQLAKYWAELNDLCTGMSEAAIRALILNLADEVAVHGQISSEFFHALIKELHGQDSIALTKNTDEVRKYFDDAFLYIERLRRAFHAR
jgi:hypothetical protein